MSSSRSTTTALYPFGNRWSLRLTVFGGFGVFAVFGLLPALAVLVISFTDVRGLPGIPVHWLGFQNYRDLLSPAQLGDNLAALKHTLVFAFSTTFAQIVVALAIALLLNQRLRGTNFYRAVIFMPTVLGVTVIGLIWSLIFDPTGGPAATVLSWFGKSSAFFGDPNLALGLVIFVQIWASVGISVVIFLAGLQAIPAELYEVASIDGANGWQRLRSVTIPMLAPSITATVLLGIVSSLQSYQLIYVLTGASDRSTQVLSLEMYAKAFGGGAFGQSGATQGYAAAISMVQFVIVGVVALAALWFLRRRETDLL
jgi:raffinose/stachyose/melibiose transport system permease protein